MDRICRMRQNTKCGELTMDSKRPIDPVTLRFASHSQSDSNHSQIISKLVCMLSSPCNIYEYIWNLWRLSLSIDKRGSLSVLKDKNGLKW